MDALVYIGFGVLMILVVVVSSYNGLQHRAQRVRQGASNIIVSLKMRTDLASQLFELIKEYGVHENYIHSAVAQLEGGAGSVGAVGDVSTVLSQMARAYPDLKANENYKLGMEKMQTIEVTILKRREEYNAAVTAYNSARNALPTVLYAAQLGFDEAEHFTEDNADQLKLFKTDSGEMLRSAIADLSKALGTRARELGAGASDRSKSLTAATLARGSELAHSAADRARKITRSGRARPPSTQISEAPPEAETAVSDSGGQQSDDDLNAH